MAWGDCRHLPDFRETHNKNLDEDGICETCAALLTTMRARISAGTLSRPAPFELSPDAAIPVEPRPTNPLADCAACGEPFNGLEKQTASLGLDGQWRMVHRGRCWMLLNSA
jgi:hypothetical protein